MAEETRKDLPSAQVGLSGAPPDSVRATGEDRVSLLAHQAIAANARLNAIETIWAGVVLLLFAVASAAQAPVEDRTSREQAIQLSQQQTGAAYRDLQQAQYEAKLAEQDFFKAQEAQKTAQKQADDMKRQLDAARKVLDSARSREAQAKKRYDEALGGVGKAWQKPPVK